MSLSLRFVSLLCAALLPSAGLAAQELRVAVAANFLAPAKQLVQPFEQQQGARVHLHAGSSGQLFAQVAQGAPFDVFLSADAARPAQLVARGLAVSGSAFTYAYGRLVLWTRNGSGALAPAVLQDPAYRPLAIANPALAPYGAAAAAVLQALGFNPAERGSLVRGNSVAQVFQFVASGHAPLGFVARSQLPAATTGARWLVPAGLHAPIAQDAVLLRSARDAPLARRFLSYLRSDPARTVIAAHGYDLEAGADEP